MKNLFLALMACLCMVGCVAETEVAYADPMPPPSSPQYGCAIVEDSFGEREVCNVSYYATPEYGVVYYDPYFGVWLGGGGYWRGGIWYHGYWNGYWNHYGSFYHGRGYYRGYSRGYYHSGHGYSYGHGSFHGGGSYHGNGGGHFGGGHGGGHR